ncbi:MAG: sigma-54-dependent transcriptional regulator [Eubacteriales bacterium]
MEATILIIDDEEHMRWIIGKALAKEGYKTASAADGAEGLAKLAALGPDLVLLDLKLPDESGIDILRAIKREQPRIPVIMITAHGTVESAIEAMKIGAVDYISKPFDMEELKIIISRTLEVVELASEVDYLRGELGEKLNTDLIGKSQAVEEIKKLVAKVADTPATVLIEGESGTGKEVVARLLHLQSSRAAKPFIAVNCSAIPENLLESELFGYEKGAFTGAVSRKKGKFEVASGGTIFLDEIGDVPPHIQVKLLRVLQEKVFERVGGNEVVKMEARIIAATNRNLKKSVREGSFREDLYYRLQVIPVDLPPLRDRKEDIPDLVDYFLRKYDYRRRIKGFRPDALKIMGSYEWPGNVRELENTVERAVILCGEDFITSGYLPLEMANRVEPAGELLIDLPEQGISLEDLERDLILKALAMSGGNQTKASRLLGITRSALIYRMEKHGIH